MLSFLSEEDVERFDVEKREPEERYVTGPLPQTTTHCISPNDLQGDEHSWLAQSLLPLCPVQGQPQNAAIRE